MISISLKKSRMYRFQTAKAEKKQKISEVVAPSSLCNMCASIISFLNADYMYLVVYL